MGGVLDLKSKLLTDTIWEGWAAVYLFLEMLEFWRTLSLKIFKMLHDEFLYDESLNSYHSHIYMLARLWATHLFFYYLWALSVVKLCRPLGACHVVKSRFTCTFTHTCYFYSGSTIHIYPPIPSPESPKNILLLIRERITKNIFVFLCEINAQVILLLPLAILSQEMSALKKKKKK